MMPGDAYKLTDPDQLDALSRAHRAHGDAAHSAADQIDSAHGTLRGSDGWGGPGYDEISQFIRQFVQHLHAMGDTKYRMADAVAQAKSNSVSTEAVNTHNMAK